MVNPLRVILFFIILLASHPLMAQTTDRSSLKEDILYIQKLLDEEVYKESLERVVILEKTYKNSPLLLALKSRAYLGLENYSEARESIMRFYELGSSKSFMNEMRKYVPLIEAGYKAQLPEREQQTLINKYLQNTDTEPEMIGGLTAFYSKIKFPKIASRAGVTGNVILDFIVEENGVPAEIRVVEGIGWGCDVAAIDALKQVKYKPAMLNGMAVKKYQTISVGFRKKPID